LSRYSNKIESVGLRKCPCYRYLIEKRDVYWRQNNKHFAELAPPKWRKTADMKKLRHCHPMYNKQSFVILQSILAFFTCGILPSLNEDDLL